VKREDVEFAVEGDVTLRGWLFVPEGPGRHPGITMAHGYAGVREHGLERFARVFAEGGFANPVQYPCPGEEYGHDAAAL
jgi:dienelactone hydrolase